MLPPPQECATLQGIGQTSTVAVMHKAQVLP